MGFSRYFILTAILFSSVHGIAGISLKKLKDRVTNQTNKLDKLAAKIKDFDLRIGSTNNSFLRKGQEIEVLEKALIELKKGLQLSAQEISGEFKQVQLAFDLYLLETSEEQSERDISQTSIHLELLQKKLQGLKVFQEKSKNLMAKLGTYEKNLAEKKREEEEVYALIIELEKRKKDMSQKYINEMEKKNRLQSSLEKSVAKSRVLRRGKVKKNQKVDFKFLLPIADFVSAQKKKNGVSFKFSETVPVKAPGNGKIVYVGELASYGNVVIIDHGKDVRSVLFGDIVSKVAKNNFVKQGQLLGYTMGDPGTVKSVYYEVRKKNKVQNTLMWLGAKQRKSIKI